jgi:glycosyltransferase involved in cell wall biosynthesis
MEGPGSADLGLGNDDPVDVIIPALDEEDALPKVLAEIPSPPVRRVIVADNGSSDGTARVAREAGATVVSARRRGYGSACLAGIDALRADPPGIVVFIDGDFSDRADEIAPLIAPIRRGEAELVIGSRTLGQREVGALSPQQRFGNALACWLLRRLYGAEFTDLGPFRAARYATLLSLGMSDPDYGWTVEMQIKAARQGVRFTEVPVSYRRRIGRSKVSGTVRGVVGAGTKILWTLGRHAGRSRSATE